MRTQTPSIARVLPDGTPLHNRLLAALPAGDYRRIREHLRMSTVTLGVTLQEHGGAGRERVLPQRRRVLDHESNA